MKSEDFALSKFQSTLICGRMLCPDIIFLWWNKILFCLFVSAWLGCSPEGGEHICPACSSAPELWGGQTTADELVQQVRKQSCNGRGGLPWSVRALSALLLIISFPRTAICLENPSKNGSCRKGTVCSSVQVGYLILKGIEQHETENYNEMEQSSKNLGPFTFVISY